MVAAASGVKGRGAESVRGHAGAKVTVASKLPMAIELQLSAKRAQAMKVNGATWTEEVWYKDGPIVVIAGTAYPQGTPPEGMPRRPTVVAGAALTFGVDKDFFDAWLAQNKDSPMVRNNMIFANEKTGSVQSVAREHKAELSGLDALTPDNDRRMPKKISRKRSGRVVDDGATDDELDGAELEAADAE